MTTKTILTGFSAVALLAALGLASGCGCSERKEAPPPHPSAPESYMNDKAFTGELAERQTEQRRLVRERNAIVERMKAKIVAKRAELGTEDEAKVQAELEKDPEWNELYKSCEEANANIERVRKGTLGVVRERLTRKEPVSK